MEEIPTQLEQDIAAAYCLFRPLIRPKTDLKRALIYIFSLLFADVLITMILCFVMAKVGISSFVYNSGNYRTYAVTFAVVL